MVFSKLFTFIALIVAFLIFGCSKKETIFEVEYKMNNLYGRVPVTISFTAGSNLKAENITYQWWINKKQVPGNQKRMQHIFTQPGEYLVEVYLHSSKEQLYKNLTLQLTQNMPPQCDFSYTEPVFEGDLVHFTPHCTDSDGKVVKYVWGFEGDKASQVGRKRYMKYGTYIVTLYATDDANATTEISKRIVVRSRR